MNIVAQTEKSNLATVYIAKTGDSKYVEFVESLQPPFPINQKWILIISTLYGCPVSCAFCDCGYFYHGKISKENMLKQIDYLVTKKFPDRNIPIDKFKIQFARMGEPSFNMAVIEVLKELPAIYNAPGLIPSISTIAPANSNKFFDELISIKKSLYPHKFQMQFSLHSTDEIERDYIIPIKKWSFSKISEYGNDFYSIGGRKISLNFALSKNTIIDIDKLLHYFNPEYFLIKVTPINPTHKSKENFISSLVNPGQMNYQIIDDLRKSGYEVILSIGEWEENLIGSNCGQFVLNHIKKSESLDEGYKYGINYLNEMDSEDKFVKLM